MGYLYLLLALAFGLTKAYCGKRTSGAATCFYNAILINFVRMCLCIAVGLLFVFMDGISSLACTSPKLLLISLLSGISVACFTVSWLLAVRTNAYMIVEVFVMGGVAVPLILCRILYREAIGWVQIIGLLLLLVAVYCMCTYRHKEKVSLSLPNFLLKLLCAISTGISDFSQKLYVKEIANASISVFNLYTYIFASIFLVGLCIGLKPKGTDNTQPSPRVLKPIFLYVVIMAACLFLNAYFKTLSAKHLDAVLLYPLNQGCAVVLSLVMSVVLFKEKTTAKGIIGIALSVVAVILINMFAPQ